MECVEIEFGVLWESPETKRTTCSIQACLSGRATLFGSFPFSVNISCGFINDNGTKMKTHVHHLSDYLLVNDYDLLYDMTCLIKNKKN